MSSEPGMADLSVTAPFPHTLAAAEAIVNDLEHSGFPTAVIARYRAEITAEKSKAAVMANNHIEQAVERVRLAGTAADASFTSLIDEAKIIRDAVRSGALDRDEGRAEWKRLSREYGTAIGHAGRAIESAATVRRVEADPHGWADEVFEAHPSIQPRFTF